ncbi:Ankyrin repeat and IBR domain-containing protein 1 [Hypsibius exemplaris]|uniref:RBR-type E3 ubiquitin transferase n=1 Tax=Hypsibius exemplaris TaxID=2072580 RepID=A0A1W0X9G1_HYPEX|nr:Ankyrin repeat and IBR domain-containing protein 1 [Hypsibius exemplaris]
MGNQKSHLRRRLASGDERGALDLLKNHDDFRKRLDVHVNYEKNDGSTPFHLACLHGMETMIRTFMDQYGIEISQRNCLQETAIHCLCRLPASTFLKDLPQYHGDHRHKCLKVILEIKEKDVAGLTTVRDTYMLKDSRGNTPLHNAAAHGFMEIVEEIVSTSTETLRLRNSSDETPVDLANHFGHESVAQFLETKTLFLRGTGDVGEIEEEFEDWTIGHTQTFDGMKVQDLQHKKDQLVVETSDMLHVPLFTAEALLRTFQWSRQALLDAWFENAIQCCKNAGVKPPESLTRRRRTAAAASGSNDLELGSPKRTIVRKIDSVCPICIEDMAQEEEPVYLACEHDFCRRCWQHYLTGKIQDGDIYPIICPDSHCSMLVPCDVIEGLVSRDIARKYLQFDIEAFVESNPNMKWCPFAAAAGSCGRAVSQPEMPGPTVLFIPHMKPPLKTSHAVDCGNGHYFCWECSGDAHEPCSCDKWTEWHQRIIDVKPEEIRGTNEALEEAANSLWLATNSKPCPFCRSPIQKTDGCNHLKCSKCKHDFCWICGDAWKKHSTATGGYFRCTRFDAVHKAQDDAGKLINAAEEKSRRLNELNRFVLYYGKFKLHEDALTKSMPFLNNMHDKVVLLASYLSIPTEQLKFLEDAAVELLKARKVLKGSFVYAYYLEDHRVLFEYMQHELEKSVEKLTVMICVRYLRTCKDDINRMTRTVRRRRHEFIVAVNKGLMIPETPPSIRKKRKRRLPGLFGLDFDDVVLQEEDGKAGTASSSLLEHGSASDPWVLDKRGRHTNFAALYDWPEMEDSDEDISVMMASSSIGGIAACAKSRCSRPCVKNPRTGVLHQFCSLRCKHYHEEESKNKSGDADANGPSTSGGCGGGSGSQIAHKLDLIIAMELSRLQMRRDLENRASSFSSESSTADYGSQRRLGIQRDGGTDLVDSDNDDPALDLAIQLSLKDLQERKLSAGCGDASLLTDEELWEAASIHSDSNSLNSGDFTQLTANDLLLDHLEKLTNEQTLKNIEPDKDASVEK